MNLKAKSSSKTILVVKKNEIFLLNQINQTFTMKAHLYILVVFTLLQCMPQTVWAQQTTLTNEQTKTNYENAKQGIEDMLIGKVPLSYERAIYLLENAWRDNKLAYGD